MTFMGQSMRRTALLAAFMGSALVIYLYLWTGTGARLPVVQGDGYTVSATFADVDNLVPASQVQIAGVRVGEVRSVEHEGERMRVTFRVSDDVAPLHEGVTVRLGERSLIGESYLDVRDGDGPTIDEGASLPAAAAVGSTQLHDVLADVDAESRQELRGLIGSLGAGTASTRGDIDAAMTGLGHLGREGHTALDALTAQSADLRTLARRTTTLLEALDTGEGQIVTMVANAERLTAATAGQSKSVSATMRALPPVMASARGAASSVRDLADSLVPVARDLRVASPLLTSALDSLPASLHELKAMIPPFEGVFDRLPPTLDRIPGFDEDVRSMVEPADEFMRDLNPMLAYLKPYGPEFAAFFANYNSALQYTDEAGLHYIRLVPHVNEQSPQSPVQLDGLYGTYNNPMPPAGAGAKPGPFQGDYPRVERDPE